MEIITIYVKTDIQNLNISFSAIMIVTLLCPESRSYLLNVIQVSYLKGLNTLGKIHVSKNHQAKLLVGH
ncbi:hypothetical protein EB796_024043 [Bugula neritina]|uniref:Uncharacterized protein n=1 Tax=Bugula neritina TaxID=10212 RepID=A0A7J7IVQ9_BUGNE|nr:hypothetical protein EB796_024043 [Bugula neritina]